MEEVEHEQSVALGGPSVVIVTGMSGAGRTEALHALEDLGYYCIDNLPPNMLVPLAELVGLPVNTSRHIAVVCDARSQEFFTQLRGELSRLSGLNVGYRLLFLDASDESLRTRYSQLRRRHPLAGGGKTVTQAIRSEREMLSSIREIADVVVDTTGLPARDLRTIVSKEFSTIPAKEGLNVTVFSFGYKYGMPLEAELVMDVRFLPNPYYDPSMRDLTGFDAAVRDYVLGAAETKAFLESWEHLLDVVMPGYVGEGKRHLSIAVGCTGGQHRSVVLAEATGAYLRGLGYKVTTAHRDLGRHISGGNA